MFICAHVKDRAHDTLLLEDDVEPGSTVHVVVPATAVGMQLMDLGLSICAEVLYHLVAIQVGADDKEALLIIEDVGAQGVIVRDQWSIGRSPALRRGEVRAGC
ncbi:unnamed protein product [Natator depressus]